MTQKCPYLCICTVVVNNLALLLKFLVSLPVIARLNVRMVCCFTLSYGCCSCITCSASTCSHGDVRVVGGYTDYEGRVEVCINGYWGHVCYNGWDNARVLVVCRQLFGENISKTN